VKWGRDLLPQEDDARCLVIIPAVLFVAASAGFEICGHWRLKGRNIDEEQRRNGLAVLGQPDREADDFYRLSADLRSVAWCWWVQVATLTHRRDARQVDNAKVVK